MELKPTTTSPEMTEAEATAMAEQLANLTPQQMEKQVKLAVAKINYQANLVRRIDQWTATHRPGYQPPIIKDTDGNPVWLNRSERRKLGMR